MDRIKEEKQTVSMMIRLYCRRHHGSGKGELCAECAALEAYAHSRLEHCPQGKSNASCRKCAVHCYSPARREQIRMVMRFAGPRMMLVSPLAAARHFFYEMIHR